MKRMAVFVLAACLWMGAFGVLPVCAAASSVSVEVVPFSVTVAGQKVGSANDEYPCLLYRNITYVPLTYYGCSAMGLQSEWTPETGLVITPSEKYGTYCMIPASEPNDGELRASVAQMPITLCGTTINNQNEAWPFLSFRDVIYMPATWHNFYDLLGRNYVFSDETGLSVGKDTGEVRDDYEQASRRKEVYDYLVNLTEEKAVIIGWNKTGYVFHHSDEVPYYDDYYICYENGQLSVGAKYDTVWGVIAYYYIVIPSKAQETYPAVGIREDWGGRGEPKLEKTEDLCKGFVYPGNCAVTGKMTKTYREAGKEQTRETQAEYILFALEPFNEEVLKPAGYDLSDLGFGGF